MIDLANLIPDFAKPVLRPLYYTVTSSRPYKVLLQFCPNLPLPPVSERESVLHYWKYRKLHGLRRRIDELPHHEMKGRAWSQFLIEKTQGYATPNARILEIGCGVGLNLNYLFLANFKNLEGIEINKQNVQILEQAYSEMARHIRIHNASIEEIIRDFKDRQFDVVLAKGVLRLIHPDSEWIFPEMARVTKCLITVELELLASSMCFPRNYKEVFETLGMRQVEEISGNEAGLTSNHYVRIFKQHKIEHLEK